MYTAETNLTPFANAPFLLDLEFRFNLRQMLANASLKSEVLDRAQLDYIIMSIDQLVDMADPLYQDGLHSLTARIDHARQCLEQTPVGANGDAVLGAAETHSNDVVEDSSRDTEAIRQIKELIPDLGDGFIRACLDYYGSNTEAVVGALFEGNLPPSLAEMDRTASSWIDTSSSTLNELHGGAGGLEDDADKPAQPDVLGSRRNIFDNDEFDIFRRDNLDWSRVQQGKTKAQPTRLNAPSGDMKTRIMEIAQRIEEDDEYDDTYDTTAQDSVVDDVYFDEAAASARAAQQKMGQPQPGRSSGAPTQSAANPTETQQNTLIRHYIEDSSIFERKRVVRNSPARTALCAQTGLTHEQIEGWYIMFRKNPRHQQIADRHATSKRPSAIEAPAAEADSDQRRNQAPTPVSAKPDFKRKEKNKAKSANHDRKRQHALKVRNTLPGPFQ
ncbi:hypothetical protein EV174_002745 [Coemansia sp. RSA 2320]|nr:hypothetical protein EV174_002745 [Coemansia sp. RSA 2320]